MYSYLAHRRLHFRDTFLNEYSVDLDGTNEYASASDDDVFSFTGGAPDLPFSWVVWMKRDGAVSNNALMGKFINTLSNNAEWYCAIIGSTLRFLVTNNTGAIQRGRTAPMATTGSWVGLAGTYDGGGLTSSFKLYTITGGTVTQIDNNNLTVGVYAGMVNGTSPLYIGAINSGGIVWTFNGLLFHPQIWNIELNTTQLDEIGTNPYKDVREYSFGANCVSAWHFPGGDADYPTWTDYVSGKTATLQNAESADIQTDIP